MLLIASGTSIAQEEPLERLLPSEKWGLLPKDIQLIIANQQIQDAVDYMRQFPELAHTFTFEKFRSVHFSSDSVNFSHDGRKIIIALDDGTVKIFDVQTGQPIRSLLDPNIHGNVAHTGGVNDASFSPDDSKIVTGSSDNTAKIWNKQVRTLQGHTDSVWFARFILDGKNVITGSVDETVKIWDADTGQLLHTIQPVAPFFALGFSFSNDDKKIVFLSDDRTVEIYNVQTGQLIHTLQDPNIQGNTTHIGRVNSADFSPDDSKIFTFSRRNETVKIWNVQTGQLTKTLQGLPIMGTYTSFLDFIRFGFDSRKIVIALSKYDEDGTVKIWDILTDQLILTLRDTATQGNTTHDSSINKVELSHDGKTIITASGDKTVKRWEAQTGQLIQTLRDPATQGNTTHDSSINTVKFSHDGIMMITASVDGTVKIWDLQLKSGEKQKMFNWFESELRPDQAAVIARLHKAKLQGKKLVLEDDLFTFNTMPKEVRLLLIEYLGVTGQKPWYERIFIYLKKLT